MTCLQGECSYRHVEEEEEEEEDEDEEEEEEEEEGRRRRRRRRRRTRTRRRRFKIGRVLFSINENPPASPPSSSRSCALASSSLLRCPGRMPAPSPLNLDICDSELGGRGGWVE